MLCIYTDENLIIYQLNVITEQYAYKLMLKKFN